MGKDIAYLSDIFDSREPQVMDEVVLISSNMSSGSVNVPGGISQFDELVLVGYLGAVASHSRGGYVLPKANIVVGSIWDIPMSSSATDVSTSITFTDENTITVNLATGGVKTLIGRKKRYATETMSTVIGVNNGSPIGTSYREKIPASMLPASMLDGAGKIKDSVSASVVIDYDGSAGGDAGEGDPCWIFNSGEGSYGVKVTILNKEYIVVQTGTVTLLAQARDCGAPFGNTAGLPGSTKTTARIKITNT